MDTTEIQVTFNVSESNGDDALTSKIVATVHCTHAQVVTFAERSVAICMQRVTRASMKQARKDGKRWSAAAINGKSFNAGDLLRGETDPAKVLAKASVAAARLPDAEKLKLIAELQAQIAS